MVKRRSARLQKRTSPSPARGEETSSNAIADKMKDLPSVRELPEPASQVPKPPTATPRTSKKTKPLQEPVTTRTPQNRTPIKPTGDEMHPNHHQASTAKPLDEARWLGFHAQGARTAPTKGSTNVTAIVEATPTKIQSIAPKLFSSPDFKFKFRSPALELSPQASRVLGNNPEDGNTMLFAKNPFTTPADLSKRKMAVPKSKAKRFSEVHLAQFKKMDSIANHASAFRAEPGRFKPVDKSLKRSPSKAELDKPDELVRGVSSLKRTQSKMDFSRGNTTLARSKSTIKLVPPSRDGAPSSRDGEASGPSKRFKRHENDDASGTRPISRDSKAEDGMPMTPRAPVLLHSQTGLPRPRSRLLTPTKASLARSQSAKTMKSTSMIPSLFRSPSMRSLVSPKAVEGSLKEGIRKTSASLLKIPGVKSILRTPSHKYSSDPIKIAAGTHMSPPPGLDLHKALPAVPATAPVKKHVNFTASTKTEDVGSPSPVKFRATSELPPSNVTYPSLPEGGESPMGSPSRRLTFGGHPGGMPGSFTFESDKQIKAAPGSTIRQVRSSDVHEIPESSKKRKLDTFDQGSDKENNEHEEDGRASKRSKANPVEPPKTPSKLPRRLPKRPSSLSKARLNFLATPRRNKA